MSNKILALFMLSQAIVIFDLLWSNLYAYTQAYSVHLLYVGHPFRFLWVPSLFLYTISLTTDDFRFKRSHLLHAIPFVIVLIYFTLNYYIFGAERKLEILKSIDPNPRIGYIVYHTLLHLQILIYIVASLRVLRLYRFRLKMIFSSLTKINLSWLTFLLYGYLVSWMTSILVFLNVITRILIDSIREINMTAFFFFFNIIFYKGFTQPDIFMSREERKILQTRKQPILAEPKIEAKLNKLLIFMDKEKPYLDSELTIQDLAKKVSISPRSLSYMINDKLNQNFFNFINHYRVEEAKKLLKKPKSQKTSILGIAFDAGFNSKSSFNSVFKNHVKMTPSQYRKANKITDS